jgi:RHS repeat-associated protein
VVGYDTFYYYLHDDQFNVLGLTDDAGNLVERYEYGDYGKPTIYDANDNVLTASAIGNPYMFNSRRYEEQTDLYYYRSRYMDHEMGRFISRDTIGLWGDENNLGNPYSYCGNNPWTHLDSSGKGLGELILFGKWDPTQEELAEGYNGLVNGDSGAAEKVLTDLS